MSLEFQLEKILRIKTTGRDDSNSDLTNYPYEATSYEVLKQLVYSEHITKTDTIIDYGSGKGRVDFFLSYMTKATMIGIEYDQRLFNRSLENLNSSTSSYRVQFINCCASNYIIDDEVTGAYFFNPFSIFILKQVLNNLKNSFDKINREIKLFFYYPSDEYLKLLEDTNFITHIEDIDCKQIFKTDDKREIIAIYKINP